MQVGRTEGQNIPASALSCVPCVEKHQGLEKFLGLPEAGQGWPERSRPCPSPAPSDLSHPPPRPTLRRCRCGGTHLQ